MAEIIIDADCGMTREEAWSIIDAIIEKHEVDNAYVTISHHKDYDALRFARKLLEQEPCKDAISRQAVLDMMQMRVRGKELYKAVYDLPPVNPQPKTGHWISLDDFRGKYNERGFKCSECDEHSSFEESFCRGCGAKMVEPQESEKDEHMTADEFAELFTESED